ncbi:superoxide dismutase [Rhodococcus sp. ABRD24]|uniref:superoxide dismutase n=1 Tax=Rhodococcus sp. ABRD24 TaxID=2507582 RepID=UPI0010397B81|nr:superoxide dismutase [Rhodococcus sp. ABRD24]QBJ96652.1 superoxide dismutase [Rhodococcus sp. ABRD24]
MSSYVLPELAYDYGALAPAISGEILELHHGAHHAAYVRGANLVTEQLQQARAAGALESLAGLERALAFNLSGHALHSIFWQNLSPNGGDRPEGDLAAAIDEFFGSFDSFRAEMTAVTGTVQGSGWGVLAWDPVGARLVVHQLHDHHANFAVTSAPLLVFDAWEHAFYLQYRNVKTDYVERLWSLVDWADVGRRFDAARAGRVIGLTAAIGGE